MNVADVVIVGAGPAGSATALRLARAGVTVQLLDRSRFPRRKICGEYQNSGALAALDRLGLLMEIGAQGRWLQGVRLAVAGAPSIDLPFTRRALACTREKLDAALLRAAIDAGAHHLQGRVDDILWDGSRVTGVAYRDEAGERRVLRARFVVGADGVGSLTARKLGVARPPGARRRFALGGHYRGFGEMSDCIEMYVGGGTYYALNPVGVDRTNVMLVVPPHVLAPWSGDIDRGMRKQTAELDGGRRYLGGVERIGDRVSIGPLAHRVRTPTVPGALLVGDAAGFLNPFTGQGVCLALSGAESAAVALLEALHRPRGEAMAFARYATNRERDFRARGALCALVTLLIDVTPLARRIAPRLARSPAAQASLMDVLAGVRAPQFALAPALLGRLLL